MIIHASIAFNSHIHLNHFLKNPTHISTMKMQKIYSFILLIFHYQIVLSSSIAPRLCRADQSLSLLDLKNSFTIDKSASEDCDFIGQTSYPKTLSWNSSTDCCMWDGVKCDRLTGKVIELDLSCSQLSGNIHSNNSLFHLSHLQKLNLAVNDFSLSRISRKIGRFTSLTYLNLSRSGFDGQVPSEISHLSKLVSLDLSTDFDEITLAPHDFELLIQNLTMLEELTLFSIGISSNVPRNLSSSLVIINLSNTMIKGQPPDEIFHLPNLRKLSLSNNDDLSGHVQNIRWNGSTMLEELDLSFTGISGELPGAIGHLRFLNSLDLSNCNFMGSLPRSIGNLTQIRVLNLQSNNFSGHVPPTIAGLEQLCIVDLSYNRFEGPIPSSLGSLKNLVDISLTGNRFTGQFPSSITNATELEGIDFGTNSLTGSLPSPLTDQFQNLILLFLGDNSFNGTIPSSLFALPALKYLSLESNKLEGQIHEFQYHSFEYINLSGNKLHGPLPNSLSKLVNLTTLDLSSNNFNGDLDVETLSNFKELRNLRLSFNNISLISKNATLPESIGRLALASCNITELDFLINAKLVGVLDLSWNNIQGEIPEWAWSNWGNSAFYLNLSHNLITHASKKPLLNIVYLDLRSNSIQGPLPVPPLSTLLFFMSHNQLSGWIPSSICKLKSLRILDISNNRLNGSIPKCVGTMSKELTVLDLQMNNLQGSIPSTFKIGNLLRTLNLRGNKLEGEVPRSLAKCKELEVLDLSNNNLSDSFPGWLGVLPKLQVLSLRSNNLHGPVRISNVNSSFSKLRMIDLSHNQLSGNLAGTFFKSFKSMSLAGKPNRSVDYIGDDFYKDTVVVITKGTEIKLERILSIFTTIDLSSNNFEGNITDSIGDLISLRQLNLSHNTFSGQIPVPVSNLSVLESLDLSSNQLVGKIPEQLTALNSLAVLNLSWNRLVGRIPSGSQFQTFQNDSYIGNDGLCGFPMSKMCAGDEKGMQPPPNVNQQEDHSDFIEGLNWKTLLLGYVVGIVLGLVIGIVMFEIVKPEWLIKVVEGIAHKMFKNRLRNKGYVHW